MLTSIQDWFLPHPPSFFEGEGEGYKKRGFASLGLSLGVGVKTVG